MVETQVRDLTITISLNHCAFLLGYLNLDLREEVQPSPGLDTQRGGERRFWCQTHLGLDPASAASRQCELGIVAYFAKSQFFHL